MANFFSRFNQTWASAGNLDDPTNQEANTGWLYIGQAPPTVEQFNSTHQWWDLKDNWLFNQINSVVANAGLTATAGDPLTLLHALQAQWAQFVLKAGDTMTGTLNMAGNVNGVTYIPPASLLYGPWTSNRVAFGWNASGPRLRVRIDGTDVGAIELNTNTSLFVKKAGDTMSGNLDIYATLLANAVSVRGNLAATGSVTAASIGSNSTISATTTVQGNLLYSSGNIQAAQTVYGADLRINNSIGCNTISVNIDESIGRNLSVSGGIWTQHFYCYNEVTAAGTIQGAYLYSTGNASVGVDLGVSRNVNINGGGYAGYLRSYGNIQSDGNTIVLQQLQANDIYITRQGPPYTVSIDSANNRMLQFAPSFEWFWEQATAKLIYWTPQGTPFYSYANNFYVAGYVYALNVSDARTKRDVEPFNAGLKEIVSLRPISFYSNGKGGMVDDGVKRYGVIGQEAIKSFSQAVHNLENTPPEVQARERKLDTKRFGNQLMVDNDAVFWASINAIKELSTKVDQLREDIQILKGQPLI